MPAGGHWELLQLLQQQAALRPDEKVSELRCNLQVQQGAGDDPI